METKNITLKKINSIVDKNNSTNLGGIATAGNTVYVCKTNNSNNVTTIYKCKNYKSKPTTFKKFTGLGHGNGMTYYNGHLYIPIWSQNTPKGDIAKINVKDWSKKIIKAPAGFRCTGITHFKDNQFLVKTGNKIAIINMKKTSFTIEKTFKIDNPKADNGYTIGQDIYYKDGKLYMPFMKTILKSVVLIFKIGSNPIANKIYSPYKIYKSSSPTFREIESLAIDKDGHMLFGLNSNADGIYIKS